MSVGVSAFVITAFLRRFAGTETLILALPVLIQAGPVLGFAMSLRLRNVHPKTVTVRLLFLARLMLLPLPVLALWSGDLWAAWAVFLCFALMTVLNSPLGAVASAWFQLVIPSRVQGRFLGLRAALGSVLCMAAGGVSGWLIERGDGWFGHGQIVFSILFGLGIACGFLDIWYLHKTGAGKTLARPPHAFLDEWRTILKPLRLWRLSAVSLFAALGPVFLLPTSIIMLYDLGLGDAQVGVLTAAGLCGQACGLYGGGILSDRGRLRLVLLAGAVVQTVTFLCLAGAAYAATGTAEPSAWGVCLALLPLTGLAAAGTGAAAAAATKLIFRQIPGGSSVAFAFVSSVDVLLRLVLAGVAAGAGGWFLLPSETAGETVRNIPLLYLVAAGVSVLGALLLRKLLRQMDHTAAVREPAHTDTPACAA